MYKLYCIKNKISNSVYVGMTGNSIERRFYEHIYNAFKLGKKTKFYDAIRRYGEVSFDIFLLEEYTDKHTCCIEEINLIEFCKLNNINIYNLAKGGEGGFVVPDDKIDTWKSKLSVARQGRRPSLGMKHSKENRQKFSDASNKYWNEHRLYSKEEILSYSSFKEAQTKTGISKTHFYRLRKQALSNE